MEYERLPIPPPEESGFLEITGVSGSQLVAEGELVKIYLSLTNTGFAVSDFKWDVKDQYGNLFGEGFLNGLLPGYSADRNFSFIMPNHNVNITITTYHKYGTTWLSDDIRYLTIILLRDVSEGDYTGINWNTASGNTAPWGITNDGNYIWITDYFKREVYKYTMAGAYTGIHWDTEASGNANPYGITTDGNYFWVVDWGDSELYKYNMAGTYTGIHSNTDYSACPAGITNDGNYLWVTDEIAGKVHKYEMDGTYTGISWDTEASGCYYPWGITTDGNYIWIVSNQPSHKVYKYTMDGTYLSNWVTSDLNAKPLAITTNGEYFWITDDVDKKVYQYGGPLTTIEEFGKGILNFIAVYNVTQDIGGWWEPIYGWSAPLEAVKGDSIEVYVNCMNDGAVTDTIFGQFVSADVTPNESLYQIGNVAVGGHIYPTWNFTMPPKNVTIKINAGHVE